MKPLYLYLNNQLDQIFPKSVFSSFMLFRFHVETHPRQMKVEAKHLDPELHPASPDWAAAAPRTPDLNLRVVTFEVLS